MPGKTAKSNKTVDNDSNPVGLDQETGVDSRGTRTDNPDADSEPVLHIQESHDSGTESDAKERSKNRKKNSGQQPKNKHTKSGDDNDKQVDNFQTQTKMVYDEESRRRGFSMDPKLYGSRSSSSLHPNRPSTPPH